MNRKKQVLFFLLVALVLAALYAWWSTPVQRELAEENPVGEPATRPDVQPEERSAVDVQKVHLDLLKAGKKKYRTSKRDIFNYYQPKPVVKKPKQIVKEPVKPVVKEPPKPAAEVRAQVRRQLARFTFLGFLVKNDERTVFLSKGEELFLVKRTDTFGDKNQFKVREINEEKLIISQDQAEGLIEITLVEEEPLIPSFAPEGAERPGVGKPASGQSDAQGPGGSVPAHEKRRPWFKETQSAPPRKAENETR